MRMRRVYCEITLGLALARWISALSQSEVIPKDSMAFQRRIYYTEILYSSRGCKGEERTGETRNRKQILWDLSRQLSGSAAKRASLLHQSGNVKFSAHENREVEPHFISEKKYGRTVFGPTMEPISWKMQEFHEQFVHSCRIACQEYNWPLR